MTLKLGILLPTRGLVMESDEPPSIEPLLSMAESVEQGGPRFRLGRRQPYRKAAPRTADHACGNSHANAKSAARHGSHASPPCATPSQLAQMAATVDTISGGRLILGAGVGGAFNAAQQQEWLNVGVKPSQRARRFEEVLEITNRLTPRRKPGFRG